MMLVRQKAPSAKRFIKTGDRFMLVSIPLLVRKNRAPKGALRHNVVAGFENVLAFSQKAPSAKRCIKTRVVLAARTAADTGQKAPSAKRRIKTRKQESLW